MSEVAGTYLTGTTGNGFTSVPDRAAHENGFNVTLPVDATADRDPAGHEHRRTQVFPGIAGTGTAQEVLELLDRTR